MKMAERAKENPEVINAIGAHHDEIEMTQYPLTYYSSL
jgi:ribonuclease Y